jgi:hypothetical protein
MVFGQEPLLFDRVEMVRDRLLNIADVLETSPLPDPRALAMLEWLLSDGCTSPLLNADLHPSELLAALHYIERVLNIVPAAPDRSAKASGDHTAGHPIQRSL